MARVTSTQQFLKLLKLLCIFGINIYFSHGLPMHTALSGLTKEEPKELFAGNIPTDENILTDNTGPEGILKDSPDEIVPKSPTANILVTVIKRSVGYREPWELNHNLCPPSLCTASDEIRPRGTGGTVFYNGDIVLDRDAEQIIYKNRLIQRWRRGRSKRATSRGSRQWPGGVVPYTFGDIADKSKRYIKKAMKAIENSTCITFREKKLTDEDYIRFISEPGCWSNVGRVGGEQKVSIGPGCERLGTAIHEIAHALGFWHEQARPDRDEYVEIIPENISPRYLPDFEKGDKELITSRGYPYDYDSVMHYSKKAFTNLGEITIKVIGIGKKLQKTIGQREKLSVLDIAQLRDMYKCHDIWDSKVTHCPDKWTKSGRSCYMFEPDLKEQFAGAVRHCENLNSKLLSIESDKENKLIKKHVKKNFPKVTTWRTGGRRINGTFKWFKGEKSSATDMDYTNWNQGHPSSYSSMALVFNKTTNRVKWEGVWLGSASQMPDHAYAVICERRARRKCIPGKHKDGRDYRGDLDHTIDGILCQPWTSQYPHTHKTFNGTKYIGTDKQNKDGLGDHNYCRNPAKSRKSRPWCYTNKKNYKWQYCDITTCSGTSGNAQNQKLENKKEHNKREANRKDNNNKDTNRKDNNRTDTNKKDNKNDYDKKNDNKKANKKNRNKNNSNNNRKDNNKNNRNSNKGKGESKDGNNSLRENNPKRDFKQDSTNRNEIFNKHENNPFSNRINSRTEKQQKDSPEQMKNSETFKTRKEERRRKHNKDKRNKKERRHSKNRRRQNKDLKS